MTYGWIMMEVSKLIVKNFILLFDNKKEIWKWKNISGRWVGTLSQLPLLSSSFSSSLSQYSCDKLIELHFLYTCYLFQIILLSHFLNHILLLIFVSRTILITYFFYIIFLSHTIHVTYTYFSYYIN